MSRVVGKFILKSVLARRLILALVLVSSLFTAILTAFQLFVDYRRGVSDIESSFSLVETSYLSGLTSSFWTFDEGQVHTLLDGMVKLPDVEVVSIRIDGETKRSMGQPTSEKTLTAEFPMRIIHREKTLTIGTLVVVASLSSLHQRLWQDLAVIFIGNALKTFLVVGFVFALFHRMVTRRLDQLVSVIRRFNLENSAATGIPAKITSAHQSADEIDAIGVALQDMHGDLATSHQSVRERERELRVITNTLPAPMVHVSAAQRYMFVNKVAEDWLGRPASEIIGQPVGEILGSVTYEKLRPYIETALSGRPQEFEMQLTFPDGQTREIEFSYVPNFAVDGTVSGFFGLGIDVSQRHLLEARLRQSQKMEAVGQLTGGIAHEFNNLLQVVVGNVHLLETDIPNTLASLRSFGAIKRNVTRGAELTSRLLSFSRQQPLAPRPVVIDKVLAEMQDMLSRTLGETIQIAVEPAVAIWTAEADPGQLENALLNLALNSRDAMPKGGTITLSAANARIDEAEAARHTEASPGDYVKLSVADSGCGMTEENIGHAFEPFFTTKDVGEGTGLGLSMVYGFAQQSGGFAEIESVVGLGTTMHMYLPRLPLAEDEVAASEEQLPADTIPSSGRTILVVEDDADVRQSLADQLVSLGYGVIEAEDSTKALAIMADAPRIDLLFTDIVMPGGLSGLDLAHQLQQQRPGLKVLFSTGYSAEIGFEAGQLDTNAVVLYKPFSKVEMARAIADILI
jgi:PAS domain S-box-containing protein